MTAKDITNVWVGIEAKTILIWGSLTGHKTLPYSYYANLSKIHQILVVTF